MTYEHQFFTTEELLEKKTGIFIFDIECFKNYFLVAFKCYHTGKIAYFEAVNGSDFPIDWVQRMLSNFAVVGFNSKRYDLVMLGAAFAGHKEDTLNKISFSMIATGVRPDEAEKEYQFVTAQANNIDLIEVAPLTGSLKVYAARLNCRHMQDLPYDPNEILSLEQVATTRTYCFNDLDNTALLLKELEPYLELRSSLSAEFNKDLRSLSDAQLAQEIINTEIERISGKRPKRPGFEKIVGTMFRYQPPTYVQFQSAELNSLIADIASTDIEIGMSGHVICPKTIDGRKVTIGGNTYTIGMGGLHSNEQRQAVTNDDFRILDRDVTGYYPNLILKNGFAPSHLGEVFLQALQNIVDKRYKAKKSGDKTTADSLKIASNGTFGKTSDPYSTIYSPSMMVQTTLTGQLSLLMAIELLNLNGFKVISANTDGFVTLCPQERYELFCQILSYWEKQTSLETEETEYKALYSRDVNNYIAVKMDSKTKAKGVYSELGSALNSRLSKNPTNFVCIDAAIAKIIYDTPVMETITACQNIERFVTVRVVKGGAQKNGKYLGKVIRWYYARGTTGTISYCTNGYTVSLSDGAKPLMTLPDSFPADVDTKRYADLANDILADVGFQHRKNEQLTIFPS